MRWGEMSDEEDLADRRERPTKDGKKSAMDVLFDLYEWAHGGEGTIGMDERFRGLSKKVTMIMWILIVGVLLSNPVTVALLHPYIAAWDKTHP